MKEEDKNWCNFIHNGKKICIANFDSDFVDGIVSCDKCWWKRGGGKSIYRELNNEIKDKKALKYPLDD